jgi:hypothetical protein
MGNHSLQCKPNSIEERRPLREFERYASYAVGAAAILITACVVTACSSDGTGTTASPTTTGAAGIAPAGAAGGAAGKVTTPTGNGGTATPATGAGGKVKGSGGKGASAAGKKAGTGGKAATAGAGGKTPGTGTAGASGGTTSKCGTTDNVDIEKGPGPFTPTHIENAYDGTSWVYYPKELGKDGCLHPIFCWGPGAGTGPSNYLDHFNHLASHGFVIISQPSSGTGTVEKAEIEWMIAENEKSGSTFYHKLDTKKIVMGGHSMGAMTTFAMADYAPITLYVLVCGGANGTTGAANIHAPSIYLGEVNEMGTVNFEADYEATKSPSIFLYYQGSGNNMNDHIACARDNLAPWTAFMRWQLYGEEKWKPDLFEGGKYCKDPWDPCKSKGW